MPWTSPGSLYCHTFTEATETEAAFPFGWTCPFREPDPEVQLAGHRGGQEPVVFADKFAIDPVFLPKDPSKRRSHWRRAS